MSLEYSACVLCGKRIHCNPDYPASVRHTWFDPDGMLCRSLSGKISHIPQRKENMHFPENKIREACRKMKMHALTEEQLIAELKKEEKVIADSDIFTAKEIREAQLRLRKPGFPSQVTDLADLLKDILDHREPEYPHSSIWKDHAGMYWFRGTGKTWLQFGDACRYPDDKPVRPLRRMTLD